MNKLNTYNTSYPLNYNECPCDIDFIEWLNLNGITNSRVFHFGTGLHHLVGLNSNNYVLGITASVDEYQKYMELSIDNPIMTNTYKVIFGDIYRLNEKLLPEFDLMTLFHLCEYWKPGAMTDTELLSLLLSKLVPGGYMLFYKGSNGFNDTTKLLADLTNIKIHEFKSLIVYQITG